MNEYTTQHDQESRTVSLLRDQVLKLQKLLEFIEDSKIFQDPDSPSSFGSAPRFVRTTPQKTRFRDVNYARIWDTD